MTNRFIEAYYDFFDRKLSSSTIVVLIISAFVLLVWIFIGDTPQTLSTYKANILETSQQEQTENIVTIDWKRYKVIFQKL